MTNLLRQPGESRNLRLLITEKPSQGYGYCDCCWRVVWLTRTTELRDGQLYGRCANHH